MHEITLTINDAIRFTDRNTSTGGARVNFPTLLGCPKCGGLRGISIPTAHGPRVVNNPAIAAQVALVQQGYNLALNEIAAARGDFRRMDGHDGWPDDWQSISADAAKMCECTESVEVKSAERAA